LYPDSGEGNVKRLCLLPLLAVWMCLSGSALASPSTPAVTNLPADITPVELTPVREAAPTNGPIVVNWHFKNKTGAVNLTVNPDGTYLLSGNYHKVEPYRDLDIVIALQNSLGGEYVFEYILYAGVIPPGGLQWSKEGKSAILKDDFKTFAQKYHWIGSYRIVLTKAGEKAEYQTCKEFATTLIGYVYQTPKYCNKFNFQ
jgi:hypothetical protein